MMTERELAEIRARLEEATPGPWVRRDPFYGDGIVDGRNDDVLSNILRAEAACDEATVKCRDADMLLLVHSRSDIEKLLAEVERLRARLVAVGGGYGEHD